MKGGFLRIFTCYNVLDVFCGQQIQKAVSTGVKDIIKDNENNKKNNNDM